MVINMLKHVLIALKNNIKYNSFKYNDCQIKILGVGEKAVKYRIHGEPQTEFAYHDSSEGREIAKAVLSQVDKSIDIYPECETRNIRYYETCDCALCANFEYCF